MRRPRALDLFCCAGGASVGLYRAGFDVVGVDKNYSKNYPFPMIVYDVMDLEAAVEVKDFDFIWASPPCQPFSKGLGGNITKHPDLIEPTRRILAGSCRMSVLENVECAPIRRDVVLTGCMFGLNTYRKRHFEINRFLCAEPCPPGPKFGPDTRPGAVTVAGGGGRGPGHISAWSDAMGIHWMTRREIVEAVPPAYAEYIARQAIFTVGQDMANKWARPNFRPARISANWDGSLSQA